MVNVPVNEELKGRLSISRNTNTNTGDNSLVITVEDAESHRKFLQINISANDLIGALSNLYGQNCTYTINEKAALNGHRQETKKIFIAERKSNSAEDARIPKKYAKHGWAYWGGYGNHHNRTTKDGKDGYICSMIRYVAPTTDFEEEQP